jgi:hypothetical protein
MNPAVKEGPMINAVKADRMKVVAKAEGPMKNVAMETGLMSLVVKEVARMNPAVKNDLHHNRASRHNKIHSSTWIVRQEQNVHPGRIARKDRVSRAIQKAIRRRKARAEAARGATITATATGTRTVAHDRTEVNGHHKTIRHHEL